ncbi:F0F1 ATP synthase subunit epsilon, partial [Listeria seeligeri]|nr:F0F1 ATP synthase subunit epsilon [Listeria seeligeri]
VMARLALQRAINRIHAKEHN